MKKRILIITASLLLLAGLGFLLFPPISNGIGRAQANGAADKLDRAKENITAAVTAEDGSDIASLEDARREGMTDAEGYPVDRENHRIVFAEDIRRLYEDSAAYNRWLMTNQGGYDTTRFGTPAFDLAAYGIDDGVYCYVSAPAIDLRLPVYLGAEKQRMSYGAAHLYGTSLPLGEDNENAVIAGHNGYIGRIFFDNLLALEAGDTVTVTTYWGETAYTVVETHTVPETNGDYLPIREGRTLLTLVTCVQSRTGSGAFDRYLVVCEKDG